MPVMRLLIFLGLAGTLVDTAGAQGTAVLYGVVTDTLGAPLRATVRAGDGETAADAQGRYRLHLAPGRMAVRVNHLGFRPGGHGGRGRGRLARA